MARLGRPRSCECGECDKCKRAEYMRAWWNSKSIEDKRRCIAQRDPDRVREVERVRNQQPHRKERRRITSLVWKAVRDGRLIQEPCEVCGAEPAEAHHDDYSKPLAVRWLCKKHHTEHHVRESNRLREAA